MKIFKYVLMALILASLLSLFATDIVPGQLIIRFDDNVRGAERDNFFAEFSHYEMTELSVISESRNIILYEFNRSLRSEREMINDIRLLSQVYQVETNPFIFPRQAPNDPYFNEQWHLENTGQAVFGIEGIRGVDVKAIDAWRVASSGNNNREIVVALMDRGFGTLSHPDIPWWRNTTGHCHIHGTNCPNNPVCDYRGWNARTNTALGTDTPGDDCYTCTVNFL